MVQSGQREADKRTAQSASREVVEEGVAEEEEESLCTVLRTGRTHAGLGSWSSPAAARTAQLLASWT